jgi:Bacterial regulatory proteins, luxR family/HNH endonuclease
MSEVRRIVETRVVVARMLAQGMSRGEIAAALSLSKSTVSYHARRLGHPVDERGARRYDWSAVQRFYDDGHGVAECVAHFGFSRQTWSAAVQRGAIVTREWVLPLEQLLVAGTYRSRHNVKNRLIRAGIKQNRCELCGLKQWRGRSLSMALHHINGDGRDNRLANLQFLCPNCHSQTENFSGRGRRRLVDAA